MDVSVDNEFTAPAERPAVSVIVPARNAETTLDTTLAALASQDLDAPFEVVVVDDGSADGTRAVAERFEFVAIVEGRGAGAGQARNAGAAASRAPVLAFTDADCAPDPRWLAEGLEAIASADLVQGSVRPDPSVPPLPFDRSLWVQEEIGLYESANIFVRVEAFNAIGGFQDWLADNERKASFASGFRQVGIAEDVWFGWSARRAGMKVGFCPEAQVFHAVFRRRMVEYVAERLRLRHFPVIVRRVPELRTTLCWRHWFLNRRSAWYGSLLVGILLARLLRSRLPLVAAIPYLLETASAASGWRRHAPRALLGEVFADTMTAAALARGSLRARTFLL